MPTQYQIDDWKYEVANDYTRRGLEDWVAAKIEEGDYLDDDDDDDEYRPALWESSPEADGETCHNCRNTTWKHDTETGEDHCAACSQAQ